MPAILISILTSLAGSSDVLSAAAIANYIGLALEMVGLVGKSDGALTALNKQIIQMLDEGRDPTDDEFAALKARSDAAHETIQNA